MLVPNVADVVAAVAGGGGRLTGVVRLANREPWTVAVALARGVARDDLSQTRCGIGAVSDEDDWSFADREHLNRRRRSVARVQWIRSARQSEQDGLSECGAARLATQNGSADA